MISTLLYYLYSIPGLIMTVFWFWMLYDCIRNEPDRFIWIWVIFLFNYLGALIYFIVRVLPRMNLPQVAILNRWKQRKEILEAEAAARHIGNAHQYTRLGDLYRNSRQMERAHEAYQNALNKDSEHAPALWGAALMLLHRKQYDRAKETLEKLLQQEPTYQYGEASLAYGTTLLELGDRDGAARHLSEHLKRWSQPEAHVHLAEIYMQNHQDEEARKHLEKVVDNMKSAPAFHYRKNKKWFSKARRLLRECGKSN